MTSVPTPLTTAAVVVAVDGSQSSTRATLWALDEATSRDLPLHLVAAATDAQARGRAESAAQAVVAAVARTGRPVTVTVEVVAAEPITALLSASRSAALICVGSTGLDDAEHRADPSPGSVVAESHCPVALIRGSGGYGWVVAQLDETPDSAAVLQCAAEQARRRRVPLRVLGVWQRPGADDDRLVHGQLDRSIESWKRRYPDLDVQPVAVRGSGLDYLRANAATIRLIVIGARDVIAINELLGTEGLAALPETSVLILDRQRLL